MRTVTPGGEKAQADPTNADTIKGWMTLGDISKTYEVPVTAWLDKRLRTAK